METDSSDLSTCLRTGEDDTPTRAAGATSEQWAQLAPLIAARRSVRVYIPASGKYDDARTGIPRVAPPSTPLAVPTYNSRRRCTILSADFDPAAPYTPADVAADADRLIAWVHDCGGVTVTDRSPRGGRHVYIPLAPGVELSKAHVEPLMRLLQRHLPTLDISPMLGETKGCITPPGSACKTGGHRELVGSTVAEAKTALTERSQSGLVVRLTQLLRSQLAFDDDAERDDPARRPPITVVEPTTTVDHPRDTPLPPWVPSFLEHGMVPTLSTRAGKPWSSSEARLATLEHHATRGWSLADVCRTRRRTDWAGFWAGYEHRPDAERRVAVDWERAFAHATRRARPPGGISATPVQDPVQLHTGGVGGIREKLAAARKWILISGEFPGPQRWSALLVVTAIAYGAQIENTHDDSAAAGGRWLSLAAGLLSEDTVWSVLRKLRSIEGSPVELIAPWSAALHTGDRYRLVQPILDGVAVEPSDWETYLARIDPIDQVWKLIGYGPWWVYEVVRWISEVGEPLTRSAVALAARVSVDTVDRAIAVLSEHGLVDAGHGWVAQTGRSPRRIAELPSIADGMRADRLARHRAARALFYDFWDMVAANFTVSEIHAYRSAAAVAVDDQVYLSELVRRGPPNELPPTIDEAAEQLIASVLGATVIDVEFSRY